jgi:hypothetical protein
MDSHRKTCYIIFAFSHISLLSLVALGGLVVIVLVIGLKVSGFKPSQGRQIFKGDKNL